MHHAPVVLHLHEALRTEGEGMRRYSTQAKAFATPCAHSFSRKMPSLLHTDAVSNEGKLRQYSTKLMPIDFALSALSRNLAQ